MKSLFWSLIFLFCTLTLFFIGKGVDNIEIMSERYKHALDAATYAAASYKAYDNEEIIENKSVGFGNGPENSKNIIIDKEESLIWFYRIFFKNLSISNLEKQELLKKYIPLKAVIAYDRLFMADENDNWVYNKEYLINYRGKEYKFTLSDQIYDISNNCWIESSEIFLSEEEKDVLLTDFIRSQMNSFLNNGSNKNSGNNYEIRFNTNSTDEKLSGIKGINFIVFCEGLPLPSYNPFKKKVFYAYSIGGGELFRQ